MNHNIVKFYKDEPLIWNVKTDANINPKLKYRDEYVIDEKTKVVVEQYSQFDVEFYDIDLIKNGEEFFLGRYLKNKKIRVAYNNGKLLIYYGLYNQETNEFDKVTKVINLYNIEDVMAYPVTEEDALTLFNPSWTLEELINPDGSLVDYNANNKQRKTKNLSRFSYYGD